MRERSAILFGDQADGEFAVVEAANGLWLEGISDISGITACFAADVHCHPSPFFAGIAIPKALVRAGPRRLAEFVAGRACAREAVRRLTAEATAPGLGPDRAPVWPEGITGSISHCGGSAIAVAGAVSRYLGLGIDLERHLSAAEAKDIAPLMLNDAERQRLGIRLDKDTISLIFSAKESLFKALSARIGPIPFFKAFELVTLDQGIVRFRLHEAQSPHWHENREFPVHLGEVGGLFATLAAIAHEFRSPENCGQP